MSDIYKGWRWSLAVNMYEVTSRQRKLDLVEMSRKWEPKTTQLGMWSTYGIPENVLNEARSAWDARFVDHILNVYGVQSEIPRLWTGQEGPF